VGKENTYRRIPQVPGTIDKTTLNELYRQFSEMIYAGEGRRGPIEKKDSLNVTATERHSPLRFSGKGNRGAGAIAFGGVNNASMFIAKGAYMNDQGSWVAEDGTAVIQEMNRDSLTPIMYRNEGLQIGQIFTPTQVGGVVVGTTPPPGGGGVVVGPTPDMGLDDLNDVILTGVVNGQILVYNAGLGQWVNQTPSFTGGGFSLAPDFLLMGS
jgi:hypothetical protein